MNLKKHDNILLMGEIVPIEKINEFKDSLIITFDFNEHNFLSSKNLFHIISDSFLNQNDFKNILHFYYSALASSI